MCQGIRVDIPSNILQSLEHPKECSETDHLLVCCDAAAPCSDINCGHGYYQLRPSMVMALCRDLDPGFISCSESKGCIVHLAEFFDLEGVRPTKIIQNTNISRLDIAWLRVITPRSRQPAPGFSCAEVTPTAGAASQHSLWAGGQSVVDD